MKSIYIVVFAAAFIVGLTIGSLATYLIIYPEIMNLKHQIVDLRSEISRMVMQNVTYRYTLYGNLSLEEIYNKVRDSVVVIRALIPQPGLLGSGYTISQGSGFVYNYSGIFVVITNYHVVHNAVNISVTFSDGAGYGAKILGSDPYTDLAVLSVEAPNDKFKPLVIVNSSNLRVGDLVIAIGNPFGLTGSMSIGIISGLRRTIKEDLTGGYPIANVIQITAPINPGNSGGPLLNVKGQVIGITTAIMREAQGVGFAIPSNTILREIKYLIENGTYNMHPWLGIICTDMNYEIAKLMHVNVTYGCLIVDVIDGGPADIAGLRGGTYKRVLGDREITLGGDIIIAINNVKIKCVDDLASYLEEYTHPGQIITVTIIRNNQIINVQVKLGSRPLQTR